MLNVRVCHADLTNQSAHIDEQIKPVVDSRNSASVVDNDALALISSDDFQLVKLDLLGDQGRNIRFEGTCADSHDDNSERELALY